MNSTLNMWYTLPNGSIIEPYSVYPFGGDTTEAANNLYTAAINGLPAVLVGPINFSGEYSLSNLTPESLSVAPSPNYSVYIWYILSIIILVILALAILKLKWSPKKHTVYQSRDITNKRRSVFIHVNCIAQ